MHLGDGWQLRRAAAADVEHLMRWFASEADTRRWGGPKFRFPFDAASFREDCRWNEIDSWLLLDPAGRRAGFGQYYPLEGRINLARIAVHPDRRGAGVGRRLVEALMSAGAGDFDLPGFCLFVYRDNAPAVSLYRALGFEPAPYPDSVERIDNGWFMVRPR